MKIRPVFKFLGICVLVVLGSMSILATGGSGGGGGGGGAPNSTFGVVAFNQGWIGIMDANRQTVAWPLLVGELGSSGGGLFDVAITPDGLTTLISNFGDSKVFFIDTTRPSHPSVLGEVDVTFFAEDIAITPNGRYALVTDGGFSPTIAIIDIPTRTLVEVFESPELPDPNAAVAALAFTPSYQTDVPAGDAPEAALTYFPSHQAVAITPDGQTVITADYFNGMANVMTMDYSSGHLTWVGAIDVSDGGMLRPVNVTISPNGQTAILACTSSDADYNLAFPVLNINGPGDVTLNSIVPVAARLRGSQSIVFNPAGTQAYAHCTQEIPDDWVYVPPDNFGPPLVMEVLNVNSDTGAVSDTGYAWPTNTFGTSQLFGVDTIAMAPGGRYLFISNPTISGGKSGLTIMDTESGDVERIAFSDTVVPDETTVDPDDYLYSIPCGLAFFTGGWY